jgi:hypothetical protein
MARAFWIAPLLVCACSDGDDGTSDSIVPSAYLTFTLSEPPDDHGCFAAAPTAYHVGSESDPLTDGKDVVSCTIHSTEKDLWLDGNLQGVEDGGANVVFMISTEAELAITMATDLTGTLELDPATAEVCAAYATTIIGDAAFVDFECTLLVDPSDPTNGCGVSGSVSFENCEM